MRNTKVLQDIYYKVSGPRDAPVVLFSHGVGMDHKTFVPQLSALEQQYRVILWDLPGHGRSGGASLEPSFSVAAADYLIAILDELGVDRASMVGQSLGSLVTQQVAYKYPNRVTATVHLGGIPVHPGYPAAFKAIIPLVLGMSTLIPRKYFYRWFAQHRAVSPDVQDYMERSIAKFGKEKVLHLTKEMLKDIISGLPEPVTQPLMIIFGEKETSFVRKAASKWHAQTPGSTLNIVPNAGHIANQDNPEVFNSALVAFLDSNT